MNSRVSGIQYNVSVNNCSLLLLLQMNSRVSGIQYNVSVNNCSLLLLLQNNMRDGNSSSSLLCVFSLICVALQEIQSTLHTLSLHLNLSLKCHSESTFETNKSYSQ